MNTQEELLKLGYVATSRTNEGAIDIRKEGKIVATISGSELETLKKPEATLDFIKSKLGIL